jgi:hypothetical protein
MLHCTIVLHYPYWCTVHTREEDLFHYSYCFMHWRCMFTTFKKYSNVVLNLELPRRFGDSSTHHSLRYFCVIIRFGCRLWYGYGEWYRGR